jgi:hypothetical protein
MQVPWPNFARRAQRIDTDGTLLLSAAPLPAGMPLSWYAAEGISSFSLAAFHGPLLNGPPFRCLYTELWQINLSSREFSAWPM